MSLPITHLLSTAAVATAADVAKTRTIHSQPSAILSTKEVEVAVTKLGGNMAPVTFFRESAKPVEPYHISPWQDKKSVKMPAPVLVTLRGDFFCVPFGGNSDAVGGEKHPPHGEIVDDPWSSSPAKSSSHPPVESLRWLRCGMNSSRPANSKSYPR